LLYTDHLINNGHLCSHFYTTKLFNSIFWNYFRICDAGENPADLFTKMIGPIILAFLVVSWFALLLLQYLGDYLWMYKFSKLFSSCSCCSRITDVEQAGMQTYCKVLAHQKIQKHFVSKLVLVKLGDVCLGCNFYNHVN